MKIRDCPSPNFGERRDGVTPDIVVLHYTAMADAEAACRTLCNPETEVSAHYLIDTAGQVVRLVPEEHRAWHAGAGAWGDARDVNSRSIGIELSNTGFVPFAAAQMDALEGLLGGILQRWDIPASRVIAHSDLAPGRKIDPGPRFDWQRLARAGLAVWPSSESAEPDPDGFRAALQSYGYTAEVEDDVLRGAFRLRFNPGETGDLTERDMGRALALARLTDPVA